MIPVKTVYDIRSVATVNYFKEVSAKDFFMASKYMQDLVEKNLHIKQEAEKVISAIRNNLE